MKLEQIIAIKKETEINKSMRVGNVLNDSRVISFLEEFKAGLVSSGSNENIMPLLVAATLPSILSLSLLKDFEYSFSIFKS